MTASTISNLFLYNNNNHVKYNIWLFEIHDYSLSKKYLKQFQYFFRHATSINLGILSKKKKKIFAPGHFSSYEKFKSNFSSGKSKHGVLLNPHYPDT